jgi:hypothetical protein
MVIAPRVERAVFRTGGATAVDEAGMEGITSIITPRNVMLDER